MHGRSADTSLAEIHYEMSELFDKQVHECIKRENFRGSRKLSQSHKMCAMKMKQTRIK